MKKIGCEQSLEAWVKLFIYYMRSLLMWTDSRLKEMAEGCGASRKAWDLFSLLCFTWKSKILRTRYVNLSKDDRTLLFFKSLLAQIIPLNIQTQGVWTLMCILVHGPINVRVGLDCKTHKQYEKHTQLPLSRSTSQLVRAGRPEHKPEPPPSHRHWKSHGHQ